MMEEASEETSGEQKRGKRAAAYYSPQSPSLSKD